eukprot:752274-Hanusia_phi.AAC.4
MPDHARHLERRVGSHKMGPEGVHGRCSWLRVMAAPAERCRYGVADGGLLRHHDNCNHGDARILCWKARRTPSGPGSSVILSVLSLASFDHLNPRSSLAVSRSLARSLALALAPLSLSLSRSLALLLSLSLLSSLLFPSSLSLPPLTSPPSSFLARLHAPSHIRTRNRTWVPVVL